MRPISRVVRQRAQHSLDAGLRSDMQNAKAPRPHQHRENPASKEEHLCALAFGAAADRAPGIGPRRDAVRFEAPDAALADRAVSRQAKVSQAPRDTLQVPAKPA
jgi:hypothetical protein